MRNYIALAAVLAFAIYMPKAAGIALIGAVAIAGYIFWCKHQAAITKAATQAAASAKRAAPKAAKPAAPRKRKPAAAAKAAPKAATKSTSKKR